MRTHFVNISIRLLKHLMCYLWDFTEVFMENQKENLNLENQDNVTEQEETKAENTTDSVTSEQPEEVINEPQDEEAENEETEKEETSPENDASSDEEAENVDNETEGNSGDASESYSTSYEAQAPVKKKSKAKIVILLVVILAIIGAVAAGLYFFVFNKSDDKFIERSIYLKDNSLYFVNPKDNSSVLITDDYFKSEDSGVSAWSGVKFCKNGDMVFYPERIDDEIHAFSLYCRYINKEDVDPIKLGDDIVAYAVDENGENVFMYDAYGNLYNHNLTERTKLISDVKDIKISKDLSQFVYLVEDGGLYLQPTVEGDKVKIDSDVTSIYTTGTNLDYIYYYKDEELYFKKADADKVKIDSEISFIYSTDENGHVYYTKENEVKGTGTLMDYINDPDKLKKSDEEVIDELNEIYDIYWYSSYSTWYYYLRNNADKVSKLLDSSKEAGYRQYVREILSETEIETVESLYYFNGEKTDLINSSCAEVLTTSSKANSIIIRSLDKVDIKKVSITDFVNTLNKKEKFRSSDDSVSKSDFREYEYFEEFKKMILGTLESDSSIYIYNGNKQIEIKTESSSEDFNISNDGTLVYYLDKYDEEKECGELKKVTITDGAVASNDLYDTDVSNVVIVNETEPLYTKDKKEDHFDLYLSKQLIDYDINYFSKLKNGNVISYYSEYDDEEYTGTLNIYKDGEKSKIDEDVKSMLLLENEDIFYMKDYSSKSQKGDLYIYSNGENIRIDYDVKEFWKTTNVSTWNFVYLF